MLRAYLRREFHLSQDHPLLVVCALVSCTNHIHIYGAWTLGARKTDCHLNMHLQLGILELPIFLQSNQAAKSAGYSYHVKRWCSSKRPGTIIGGLLLHHLQLGIAEIIGLLHDCQY